MSGNGNHKTTASSNTTMNESNPSSPIPNRQVRRSQSSTFTLKPDTLPPSSIANHRKPSLPIVTHSQLQSNNKKDDNLSNQRLPMRTSASTRFGKNLLPAWLGRQQQQQHQQHLQQSPQPSPSPSLTELSSVESTSSVDLETQFESLLDELDMKDDHRQNLRQLPVDQQMYLLQQNVNIKNKQTSSPTTPSSASTVTELSPQEQNAKPARPGRQKSLLKPVTSTRSLFSSHLRKSPSTNAIPTKAIKPPNPASSSVSSTVLQKSQKAPSGLPSPPGSIDKRAANYKFRRNNMKNPAHANSRVGSMILEFNALAHHDTNQDDESASAWLLLDNSTLDTYTSNAKSDTSNTIHHSLSRKEASHLSSLINSDRSQRERNSPYIYVERLRSRNASFETLLKHLISLKSNLDNGSDAWVKEFLSRRHDGLSALEHVLERFTKKKKKKATNVEELCLLECIQCIRLLINNEVGLEQVVMRPSILHQLLLSLFSALTVILTVHGQRGGQSESTSLFGKSPSLSSIGSHLLPSFSTSTITSTQVSNTSGHPSSDGKTLGTLFKLCGQVFQVFIALCLASHRSYEALLQVLSEIRGEQYRFERLIQNLCSFRLDLAVVDPMVWEYKTSALTFFNAIVNSSESIETRCALRSELDRRGFDEYLNILQSSSSITQPVECQIKAYLDEKHTDLDLIRTVENVKRQSVWGQSDDIIINALKSFNADPEMYYIVVETLWELLKLGQDKLKQDKSLAMDIWSIIKTLASTMTSVQSSGDFQTLVLQFLQSSQPIVGKLPIDMLIEGKCIDEETTPAAITDTNKKKAQSLEDIEGLHNMVEELKEALHAAEESMTKIRREKNDLAMKVKERDNKIISMQHEHQKEMTNIQQQQDQDKQRQQDLPFSPPTPPVESSAPALVSTSAAASPPPPPPPPPPLLPSVDPMCINKRRKNRARSSSRSSKYLHPLAMNLCFPSLKSLHENTVTSPTSPTSGLKSNVTIPSDLLANGNALSYPQMIYDESYLQHMSSITMKQFFWSKLPQNSLQNTVWKEITPNDKTAFHLNDDQALEYPSMDDQDDSMVELDTLELERLFRKTQGGRQHMSGHYEGLSDPPKLRKQNLVTLLEFNRANNIAIMLARIKLTYPEIRDAIWNIDDNRLTIDNLMAIRQYIPTKEEIEIIQEYDGDVDLLGNAERYFKAIMYIPRLADRIGSMIFRRKFHYELQELLPELDTLQYAIDELRHSHRFKTVLKTILAIGNYLNSHTIRGDAHGFHLDALLKMRDTKAEGEGVSNLPTLLHYLVYFLSKTGQDVVNFKEDVAHLEAAAKLSPPVIFASVNTLNGNLAQIRDELCMHQRKRMSMLQIDRFAESMEEFLIEAEPIVENVKSMARNIEDQLKDLIMYYGEDPALVKSEDFFSIIYTFSSSFEKAKVEIHEARERVLRRQRQQQDLCKKKSMELLASPSLSTSSTVTYCNHSRSTSYGDLTMAGERPLTPNTISTVTSTSSHGLETANEDGFDQVLKELRAGLKRNDHSWRVKRAKRKGDHCDDAIQDTTTSPPTVLI